MRRHVVDALLPDRSSEVAALRSELVAAQAEAAHWQAIAAETALGYGRVVRERDEARQERDRAQAWGIAVAEQQPEWHEGPAA